MLSIILVLQFLWISSLYATQFAQCPGTNSMGTVLFTASDVSKQCWSPDEIAILTARMILEDVLPEVNILYIDSNCFVNDLVEYFKMLINIVRDKNHGRKKHILLLALTDLIGGYLQHAVLPIARNAYYAGLIDFTNMEKLIELHEEMKWFLHTNGQGWAKPLRDSPEFEVEIIDLRSETVKTHTNKSCCNKLIYYEHDVNKKICLKAGVPLVSIHFPLPFFDSTELPTAIAVPFRKFPVRNIESRKASYVLLKYFILSSQCLIDRQATQESIKKFHDMYFSWIELAVLPKLKDDKFYSAFGGILRVYETLKSLGAEKTSLANTPTATERCEEDEGIISPEAKPVAKRSTAVIIIMIVIITIWFVIGTAYICYRMRRNRSHWDKKSAHSTSSGWSMLSRSSSNTDTRKSSSCKCYSSEKSTDATNLSYSSEYDSKEGSKSKKPQKPLTVCFPPRKPPFMVDDDNPAVIDVKQAIKMLPSIAEMSEHSSHAKEDSGKPVNESKYSFSEPLATSSKENIQNVSSNKKKLSFSMDSDMKLIIKPCPKYPSKGKSRPFADRVLGKSSRERQYDDCYCKGKEVHSQTQESSADSSKKGPAMEEMSEDTDVSAKSPRTFACHSSLTGDHNNEYPVGGDKPYIFGYDFQSSSSSEGSDDEDVKTSTSEK